MKKRILVYTIMLTLYSLVSVLFGFEKAVLLALVQIISEDFLRG